MLENLITELKLRGFSKQTIKAYFYHNHKFLYFCKKPESEITETDVKNYLAYLMHEKQASSRTIALVKASLKFYFDELLKSLSFILGYFGVSIAGQVDQEPLFIDEKMIDQLCFTRFSRSFCQMPVVGKHIDQR